jgi:hypothetical protein
MDQDYLRNIQKQEWRRRWKGSNRLSLRKYPSLQILYATARLDDGRLAGSFAIPANAGLNIAAIY